MNRDSVISIRIKVLIVCTGRLYWMLSTQAKPKPASRRMTKEQEKKSEDSEDVSEETEEEEEEDSEEDVSKKKVRVSSKIKKSKEVSFTYKNSMIVTC